MGILKFFLKKHGLAKNQFAEMTMNGAGVLLAVNRMNKTSIWAVILAALSLVFACGRESERPEETGNSKFLNFVGVDSLSKELAFTDQNPVALVLNPSQIEAEIKLSDIIVDYRLLSLKNWEGGVIGSIDKVLLTDSLVFILDQYTYNSLQIFDLFTGEQVGLLYPTGEGPGEMKSVSEFDLDEANHRILIYDNSLAKILYFSFAGKFIEERRLPLRAHSIKSLPGNELLISSINDGNEHLGKSGASDLFLIDGSFNIQSYFKYPKIDQQLSNYVPRDVIRENEGLLTYFPRFSNELIQYDGATSSLNSIMQVDLGYQGLSEEDFYSIGPEFISERAEDKKFYGFGDHFVTPKWIGMSFDRYRGELHVYYNRMTGEVVSGSRWVFDFEDLIFYSFPAACRGNLCITDILIDDFAGVDLADYFNKVKKEGRDFSKVQSFLESIEDFENPILLISTLK